MRRRPAPPFVPLALVALIVGGRAGPARGENGTDDGASSNEHYTLRAELGPEIDTNAHRTEVIKVAGVSNAPAIVSPLARAVLSATLSDLVATGHQVVLSATAAAKIFQAAEARNEDVGIAESTGMWRMRVGTRTALAISGVYYEAFQRTAPPPIYASERRDFRSLTPSLRLVRALTDHFDVGLGMGYRLFAFKPDRDFDFRAPTANLDLSWARESADGAADWEASLRTGFERRVFNGPAFVDSRATCAGSTCPPTTGTATHIDNFVTSALNLSRTGRVLIGGGYALHANLSNSFGETVMRHYVTARFAAALPLELYLAARAEVLLARYTDRLYLAQTQNAGRPFVSIDDENRSSARVDLSRNLTDRLQLTARYTFYANELGTGDVTYRRHTALLSLSFTLEK